MRGKGVSNVAEIAGLVVVLFVVVAAASVLYNVVNPGQPINPPVTGFSEIPKFASCTAMNDAFKESAEKYGRAYGGMRETAIGFPAPMAASKDLAEVPEYSATNIQVEGVDEADIVKTDGKYIYTISQGRLVIAEAFPAEEARIVSVTDLKDISPNEMFLEENTVAVFGQKYYNYAEAGDGEKVSGSGCTPEGGCVPPYVPPRRVYQAAVVQLWNTGDKENPVLEKTLEFEGSYVSSRKIGGTAYIVVNSYPQYYPVPLEEQQVQVPLYRETVAWDSMLKDFEPIAGCGEIGYLEPVRAEAFITIASISLGDFGASVEKETVVGSGENVYASTQNIYLAETRWDYEEPVPLPVVNEIMPIRISNQKTIVHKFSLAGGKISYIGNMEAQGHILNQFSMDEFNGYFRIATTAGQLSRSGGGTTNNIYIFGPDLQLKGKLEDLAPGESIYSARFMGERAYLVTFKKIDPLFVIDLGNPAEPRVLGKLKIPGYSDYLHPFDETHIIGIGKEAEEAEEGDFAWYQGVKLALFDVSDVENPIELYKETIGDRGTDSYALHDHKAFLFDREKELLVIPILLAEINEAQYKRGVPANTYGDYVFQGAYVYNLSLDGGFELKGRVTHVESDEGFKKAGYYYGEQTSSVKRALYIDNILYTVSDAKILLNSLTDLRLLKELEIPGTRENNWGEGIETTVAR